jgi:Holliday junction DNA helicase RuvA
MITQLKGKVVEVTPAYVVIDCNGVGYMAHISLNTFTVIKDRSESLIYTQFIVREDAHLLYGFADKHEREIFVLLVSVSGIGAATARMILSSLTPEEIRSAIATGDVRKFKAVKGVGEKSAQRIIIDLKDKVGLVSESTMLSGGSMSVQAEAAAALSALGFSKPQADKALSSALKEPGASDSVEKLIKLSLKFL